MVGDVMEGERGGMGVDACIGIFIGTGITRYIPLRQSIYDIIHPTNPNRSKSYAMPPLCRIHSIQFIIHIPVP